MPPVIQSRFFHFLLIATALLSIAYFTLQPPSARLFTSSTKTSDPPKHPHTDRPKNAFVTFLQGFAANDHTETDEEDIYFLGTRVMGYQLMHSPKSRSNTTVPFVILVTKDVSERKRRRLEADGCVIIEVEKVVTQPWISTGNINWEQMMTKLRAFQLTQYDKILYMDADMLLTRPMDGIFSDPGTDILSPKDDIPAQIDEDPLPTKYMIAGQAQQTTRLHPYPPDTDDDPGSWNNYFCGGFWVAHPSQAIFAHYMSIMNIANRFDPGMMEQNLLNYAHRRDGPMPWKDVYYTWTSTYPTYKEYEMGAASLHEKYWREDMGDKEFGQDKLRAMWLEERWAMEAFYKARDARRRIDSSSAADEVKS